MTDAERGRPVRSSANRGLAGVAWPIDAERRWRETGVTDRLRARGGV